MTIVHKISMDLQNPRRELPLLHARQGEVLTRQVAMELFDGEEAWEIPAGASPVIRYQVRNAGTGETARGIYDTLPEGTPAWELAGNVLTLTLVPAMLAAPGTVFADVVLVAGEKLLATGCFRVEVEPVPADGTEPQAQNYYRLATLEQINAAYAALDGSQQTLEENHSALWGEIQRLEENKVDRYAPSLEGDLEMNSHRVRGIPLPLAMNEAAPKEYVDQKVAGTVARVTFVNGGDGQIYAEEPFGEVYRLFREGAVIRAVYDDLILQAYGCLGNTICFVNRSLGENSNLELWLNDDESVTKKTGRYPVSQLVFTGMADEVYDGTQKCYVHIPRCVPVPYEAEIGQVLAVAALDEDGIPSEWEPVDRMVVPSSTPGSTKRFRITVDDGGSVSAREI